MIPQHILSSVNFQGYYYTPDSIDPSPVVDYELGGVALNDPSQGLQVKPWKARLSYDAATSIGGIYIGAPDVEEVLFYSQRGITEMSLAFDQNMQPFICFMQNGQAKYYWFDPTIPGYTTATMAAGVTSPKCCIDDKRKIQTGTSDIILAYIRAGNLYYREQRDRFTIEYLLKTGVVGEVLKVGMTHINRLMFAIGNQEFPTSTIAYRYATGFRRRVAVGGGARRIAGVNYGG
jgi:hypothetical protein